MNSNVVSLPNKPTRKHRYRKGYLKKRAKNLDRKEHENKIVSFNQINHVGITYENYNRTSIKNTEMSGNRKVWFSGRTKANTKFNKFLIEDKIMINVINIGNYNGDCTEEIHFS